MKVKKGWLAVEVEEEAEEGCGEGSQRFMIPISYLYHPLFNNLLDKAYEVYGYHTEGPLKLPCSVDDFLHLRWRIHKESTTHHRHNHNHNHHHHHQLSHSHFLSCDYTFIIAKGCDAWKMQGGFEVVEMRKMDLWIPPRA
ncbi:unnamed protein product [Sphenostylis stenocarpa]|uniref:Uncharacterized protein n=1 Tax=Sphenostylis stenocarpa TaxID=92480 RepID=A0AA86VX84_9FABA|nr:unnamed protein product [Sphenostylis stenocarpa]